MYFIDALIDAPQSVPVVVQPGQQTTIVISPQTIVIFGEVSVAMTCPFCLAQIVTATRYVIGERVLLWMAICYIIG